MKFKEIKPGMVIHCPKEEDARMLLEHLENLGYAWCVTGRELTANTHHTTFGENTCYRIDKYGKYVSVGRMHDEYGKKEITEFSDLVESEPDLAVEVKDGKSTLKMRGITISEMSDENSTMTAEELLKRLTQCLTTYDVEKAKAFKRLYDVYEDEWGFTDLVSEYSSKEIIDIITDYEAKKVKKSKPVEYGKHLVITNSSADNIFAEEFWFEEHEESYEDFKLDKMRDLAREIDGEVLLRERDICRVVKE